MSCKLNWVLTPFKKAAAKKAVALAAAKKAVATKRAAEKRARFNDSNVVKNLVAEKCNLEEKLNTIEAKIEGFNKNIISISLGQGEIEIENKDVTFLGNTINIEVFQKENFSRFKRSLKRLLERNNLNAAEVFEMNNIELEKANKVYTELAFLKASIQKIEQEIVSLQKRIDNPAKAHRKQMILESKANSFVCHYHTAQPATNARARRARLRKFNQGKTAFLEVYGNLNPVQVKIEATAEFTAKVCQLNGAPLPAAAAKSLAAKKEAAAERAAVKKVAAEKAALKPAVKKAAKKLTTAAKKAAAKLVAAKAAAEKAVKEFIAESLKELLADEYCSLAFQELGYKNGPRSLKGIERLAKALGKTILRIEDSFGNLVPAALIGG